MVANGYLMFQAEPVRGAQLSNTAPFANVIFLLALLTAANALLARRFPHRRGHRDQRRPVDVLSNQGGIPPCASIVTSTTGSLRAETTTGWGRKRLPCCGGTI